MSLLHDLQAAVLNESADLGPILLKLRLLAARIGSQPLAEWVKHESEGYPPDADVPDYRIVPVSYRATFSGPFGMGIKNAPIAPYLIEKFAGKAWNRFEMRQSIAAIDDLLANSEGSLEINASNLMLALQGNVYEDYACNEVKGTFSSSALAAIRHSVRSRVLELTIELERSVPQASAIELGKVEPVTVRNAAVATQISQQIIYGNVTSITSTGEGARINVGVAERDAGSLAKFLVDSGLPEEDARDLTQIVSSEEPESASEPMGAKARKWLVDNLKKAADGTWKMGLAVATDVIKEALMRYYGLK